MRQGNGTDLLGLNDPRSASIGIIYVAQNDDRKSVLAALITQEKLGRKQVAVVLPEQNQAFQRPGDFDDLKGLRNKLQTQIVFIAPPGPGPAEFARQRRFTVYSSLESYAKALRDEGLDEEDKKRGGFVAGAVKPVRDGSPPAGEAAASSSPLDSFVIGAGAASVAGAAIVDAAHSPQPPAPVAGTRMPTPVSRDSEVADQPTKPIQQAAGNGAPGPGRATGSGAARAGAAGSDIIELSPATPRQGQGRTTKKLPIETGTGGGRAAVAGIGAGAGVAAAAAAGRGRSVTHPPQRSTARRSRRHPVRNTLIVLVLLLLTLLIACGSLAYIQPKMVQAWVQQAGLSKYVPKISLQPGVTVTVVPTSQVVSDSFVVAGLPGSADATKLQINTRSLSYTTPLATSPVTATGVKSTNPIAANGKLTFYNYGTIQTQVNGQTVFTGADGVSVVTTAVAVLPAGVITGTTLTPGVVSVSAVALKAGASGNIATLDINGTCCVANGSIIVKNQSVFTGGQDAQHYAFIQVADVNAAIAAIQPGLITKAQTGLKGQLQTGELLAGNPQCTPKSSVDQPTGDTGKAIPSATASVSVTCTAQAYKQADLNALAQTFLAKKVTADPTLGPNYGPVGEIITTTTLQGINQGIVSFLLSAKQVWAYQFNATQKQALATLIKGLSAAQAVTKLKSQPGISNATIPTGVTTLSTDATLITIEIQTPAGLSGGSGGSTTPTVPAGTGTPIQGNGSIPFIA